jgi:uncharacterized protein (TIGR03067 family)
VREVAASVAELDGTWFPIAAYVSGEVVPIRELRIARLVLSAGSYAIIDRERHIVDSGAIHIGRAASPRSMDIVGLAGPHAGKTMRAIFEHDRDLLMICYDLDAGARPDSTEPQRDQLLLQITYARAAQQLS